MDISRVSAGPPTGGPGFTPQQLQYIRQQFDALYMAFMQDPSTEHARQLLNFLNPLTVQGSNYQALLQLAHSTDYPPFPGTSFIDNYQAAETALTRFVQSGGTEGLDQCGEFLQDMAQWIGATVKPHDVVQAFEQMITTFDQSPSVNLATYIQWFLSTPGYRDALIHSGPSEMKIIDAMNRAQSVMADYLQNPSNRALLQDATAALQNLNTLLQQHL